MASSLGSGYGKGSLRSKSDENKDEGVNDVQNAPAGAIKITIDLPFLLGGNWTCNTENIPVRPKSRAGATLLLYR